MNLNNEARQQLEKLARLMPALHHCMFELIQFFEFFEQAIDTFPTAAKDFSNSETEYESAPIYTLQQSFKHNVLICVVKMYDKNKEAASIPNAVKILQNEDIRFHFRLQTSDAENFDEKAAFIDSIAEQVQKDFRFDGAQYMRNKHIAHRDISAVVNWDRLTSNDIGTLYIFTTSIIEAINQILGLKPNSYTIRMNQWQIIARDFHKHIPYSRKISEPRPLKISGFHLGTREEFIKTFFGPSDE